MRRIILLYLFIICSPFFVSAQKWHSYSDSIISNINKNDFEKATNFSKLADAEINITKIIKDTLYSHYLYAKGVLNYFESKKSVDILKESLDIWNNSEKKNYFKIMKIHYFLGQSYYQLGMNSNDESDFTKSYNHFENCYLINKKYNLPKNSNFSRALFGLIILDSKINKDYKKGEKYANEYIELNKESALKNYDFNLITVYREKKDFVGQEKVLQEFLSNYENEKLDEPKLLYNIYVEFVNNNISQKDKYGNIKNVQDIIKYGEKAFSLLQSEKLPVDNQLGLVLSGLVVAYIQLADDINSEKYYRLNTEYFPISGDSSVDMYEALKTLIENEDYKNFKIKFDEYEEELKIKNNYSRLAYLYRMAIELFNKNILFTEKDVLQKLNFIKSNIVTLSKKEQAEFEFSLIQFYSDVNPEEALKICNKNLNVDFIDLKLVFNRYKSTLEARLLQYFQANETAYKTLQIAIGVYGENDPRLLEYYCDILSIDALGNDNNSTKITTSALKIIYDNKLEDTDIAAKIYFHLSNEAKRKGNYVDCLRYLNKCISVLEKKEDELSFILLRHCIINKAEIDIKLNDFEIAKKRLDLIKDYLDDNREIKSGYYIALGDINYFQNNITEAKNNYTKGLIEGENQVQVEFRLILCDYLLEKNNAKTIASLEKFDRENKTNLCSEYVYLLRYNSEDFKGAQKLLIDNLEKLINENNEYFHLLSDYEKSRLYKGFSDQFEFLNNYLLIGNSNSFINRYIDFRFYSKSLLFSNSFKVNFDIEKNKELYTELKNNEIQIIKNIENKKGDSEIIDNLQHRNREIEKLLSIKTKPLSIPTVKSFKNKLKLNEAYVEIVRINKQSNNAIIAPYVKNEFTNSISYGAIIIKKNANPKFVLIDDTNQLENKYASDFKDRIKTKQQDSESYHLLFEKIEKELKNVNKIFLVTDGAYNSINIESLYNPNKKQFVIDYLKIQQIQNVRAITDQKKEFKIGSTSKAVLFGNPNYDLAITNERNNEYSLERTLDSNLLNEIKTGVKISSLNGTQKEIENLNSILKDSKCSVEMYSTKTATEDNLKNVQTPDILHVATHAYFLKNDDISKTKQSITDLINEDYKNDPYLKSGLLLAGAQNTLNGKQPENANNGILTAEEAKSLNLKGTELVVLSACETGLGDNLVGEGVIGLQRAFMIAGAKSVIMSLWSVSDEKTQQLMTLFYTNWIKNNMSKEEAFYQAKIEMKKLYPQPYYWAGFVLLE